MKLTNSFKSIKNNLNQAWLKYNTKKNKLYFFLVCFIITSIFLCLPYTPCFFKGLINFITSIFRHFIIIGNIYITFFFYCILEFINGCFIIFGTNTVNKAAVIILLNSGTNNYIPYILLSILLIFLVTKILYLSFFNGIEKFNQDSKYICTLVLPSFVVLNLSILFQGIEVNKQIKNYFIAISLILFLLSIYFWIIYLMRCKKIINEINKDWYIFLAKMVQSMVIATLICYSGIVVIMLLEEKYNTIKVCYQAIYTTMNLIYPFIDMYTYVRSEIDEFDKQEQEKNEKQKQLIKEKREELEKEKQEQEKEKYKYDFYNYD